MKVYGLRCDAMENPLGISVVAPRLSWKMEAEERQVFQTAYQVVVSEDATGRIVYDSGMIRSQDNFKELPEICTMSSIRYNWHVTVRDNYGRKAFPMRRHGLKQGFLWKRTGKQNGLNQNNSPQSGMIIQVIGESRNRVRLWRRIS